MSITDIMNKFYINSIESIQNCHKQDEKRKLVKELIENLKKGKIPFSERELAREIKVSRQLIHKVLEEIELDKRCVKCPFIVIIISFLIAFLKVETRGRKKFEENHPNIVNDIKEICEKTKNIDKSIKGEIYYTDVTLQYVKEQLEKKYNYSGKDLPSVGTIRRIMTEILKYKLIKVKKCLVLKKIAETDSIFENVHAKMQEVNDKANTLMISIDDKANKLIGKLSALGYSWLIKLVFDHDTNPDCIAKPFGIMDLTTASVYVFCTLCKSTANFKVDCIEEYLVQKLAENPHIKKLMIFLDNGPENSSRRKLWMYRIIQLAIKYKITIELIYYPPYHSKYNPIEHFWGVLQKHWSGMVIDNLEKLIGAINSTKWKGVNAKGYLRDEKVYNNGEKVDEDELAELIKNHVSYPNENIKKWSLIVTP